MQRILAIAVGLDPERDDAAVWRNVVGSGRTETMRPYVTGLIAGLERLGLRAGTDFQIDYATAPPAGLRKLIKGAIAESRPDAIFAMSTSAVKAAMSVTRDIQIVFPSVSDPVADGVVKSCSAPGKNATGIRAMRSHSAPECLELFKATVPSLRKVFGLHKPSYGPADRAVKRLRQAARRARITFTPLLVRSHQEIATKLAAISQSGRDGKPEIGVLALPDDLVLSAWRKIAELGKERRLPTFLPVTDWVKNEGASVLAGYGVPQRTCGEAAAPFVYKVLKGVPAKDLPVKRAGGFEWAVNKAVAGAIGVGIPESVIKGADRVVG